MCNVCLKIAYNVSYNIIYLGILYFMRYFIFFVFNFEVFNLCELNFVPQKKKKKNLFRTVYNFCFVSLTFLF